MPTIGRLVEPTAMVGTRRRTTLLDRMMKITFRSYTDVASDGHVVIGVVARLGRGNVSRR